MEAVREGQAGLDPIAYLGPAERSWLVLAVLAHVHCRAGGWPFPLALTR